MHGRAPVILLGSLSLFACASQPSPKPSVDLPTAYRASSLDVGSLQAVPLQDAWWRSFRDPVLDRVVDDALLGNLDIEAAAARLERAAGASRVAASALAPSGTIGGSASSQRQSLDDPQARIASAFPNHSRTNSLYGLNAAASWELDVFGRLAAARRASKSDQAASAAEVDGARLTVAAEIAAAYITARELQARADIADARIGNSENLRGLVALRLAEGSASRLEMDMADADLSASKALKPVVEAALDETFNRIDLLSGRAPGHAAERLDRGPVPAAVAVATNDGPAALLTRRPDVVAAEQRVAASDARVAEAITAYYPRLSIQGLVGYLASGPSALFSDEALQAAGSAGVSGRLFDFGAARGGVVVARARTREAVAAYRTTVLRAAAEAEDGFSRVARDSRRADELRQGQAAFSRASTTARIAFELGGSGLKDSLDAQRRLLDVQDASATAQADAARASVMLFRALGGGWSLDRATRSAD